MRLSWKHKFVYISIHKTASETVRHLLNPYSDIKSCGDRQTICYHHIPAKKMKYYFDERYEKAGKNGQTGISFLNLQQCEILGIENYLHFLI